MALGRLQRPDIRWYTAAMRRAAAVILILAGCSAPNEDYEGPDLADLSAIGDLSSPGADDMAAPLPDLTTVIIGDGSVVYTMTNVHDVDMGTLAKGSAVQLSGLIVLAPPTSSSANADKDCVYRVWAQDPACSTPPCGLVLQTKPITNPNGTGNFCPFASQTATLLHDVWKGDRVDVAGTVDTTVYNSAGNMITQHELVLDSLNVLAKDQALPLPMTVTDTDPSLFVPYSGAGWAMYEGTRIKLQPSGGKFTTTLDAFGGWTCAPGGAHYVDTYTGFFRPDGSAANSWPPNGSMFASISGIVSLSFGGGIMPTSFADFVP